MFLGMSIQLQRFFSFVGYRDAWQILPSYPRATFAVLDRGDHGLPVDAMPLFEALVMDWISRVCESNKHHKFDETVKT